MLHLVESRNYLHVSLSAAIYHEVKSESSCEGIC